MAQLKPFETEEEILQFIRNSKITKDVLIEARDSYGVNYVDVPIKHAWDDELLYTYLPFDVDIAEIADTLNEERVTCNHHPILCELDPASTTIRIYLNRL